MQYKLRESLVSQDKISYAKDDGGHHWQPDIDCSAGSNPFFMPDAAQKALSRVSASQANLYPHDSGLKTAICQYLGNGLTERNILLSSGSMNAIYVINAAFLREGAKVLGICPQFSYYMSNARVLGYDYRAVPLCAGRGWSFDCAAILDALDDSFSLVYIDNPNNPTGQVFPLDDLRAIADAARKLGVCVIIDEAYGEFMEPENSAVSLLGEYDNLIVPRTFSKGWGLAGLRAGYLAASCELIKAFEKLSNPYAVSEPARMVCQAAMSDKSFLPACRQSIAARKTAMRKAIGRRLRMAPSCDTVPICLLEHEDAGCDLQQLFAREGVSVVSGGDFLSLGRNTARLRLPEPSKFDALIAILQKLDQD